MVIQTDADGTIYRGNLLISLGWGYARFLFKEKKYFSFADKIIRLPFFYFFSHLPFFIGTAFTPFRGCPLAIAKEIRKPVRKKWLAAVEKINPQKIIIVSRQEKNLLRFFVDNSPELKKYNIEIISNAAEIQQGNFTGKFNITIRSYRKHRHIDKDLIYLGDLRDYLIWGRKKDNFILI